MLQRVLLGQVNEKWVNIPDINRRELLTLVPLMIIVIIVGIYPLSALKYQMASISELIHKIGGLTF